MSKIVTLLALAICLCSCEHANVGGKGKSSTVPLPGAVIDSASMPTTDTLNNFAFTVVLTADSAVAEGVYDVRATIGPNVADGKFTMPKGLEQYRLAIRKGTASQRFVVGFLTPKDTTFYEYFEVADQKNGVTMQYLKSYTFE